MTNQATWSVEHSWEATTMDYMNPLWYSTQEGFETEAEAEAFETERRAAASATGQMIAYRVRRVPSAAERDEFLEAEFAANASYWSDRARAAEREEQARQRLFALKGQTVTVVKGRKVPVGTTGEVFWVGEGKYGWRVGIKDAEGEVHWTAVTNVEAREMASA